MPVRRHSIDLPTANDDRRSTDVALAEPIVEGVIVPEGIDRIIKLEAADDRPGGRRQSQSVEGG